MSTRERRVLIDDDVCLVELGGALAPSPNSTFTSAILAQNLQYAKQMHLSSTLQQPESSADVGDAAYSRTSVPYARLENDNNSEARCTSTELVTSPGPMFGDYKQLQTPQLSGPPGTASPALIQKMRPSNDAVLSVLCILLNTHSLSMIYFCASDILSQMRVSRGHLSLKSITLFKLVSSNSSN